MSQYQQVQAPGSFSHSWTAGRSRPLNPPEVTAPSSARPHVQQTKEPATTWQLMADHSRHAENNGAAHGTSNLSFYQRHFTRPIIINPDKPHRNASDRSFSLRTRGFLIVALIMVIILLGIIGAAIGVSLAHPGRHRHQADAKHPAPIQLALAENFPDPALYLHDKTWYAYATNNAAGILQRPPNAPSDGYGVSNIQVATSTNFVNWTLLDSAKDPLPDIAAWALHGHDNRTNPPIPRANVWAPSITKQPADDGKYIMYYAAARNRVPHPGEKSEFPQLAKEPAPLPHHPVPHCIGAATASTPLGPFDSVPTPIACPVDAGGAIDAAAFTDHDATPYVLYKVDGNNIGNGGSCGNMVKPRAATPIMLQKLKSDMLTPDGVPDKILDRTDADGPLVEAPELVRSSEGIYFLFFSSGCTREPTYDLKYATATDIKGPYTRAGQPLLQTGDWDLHAPGSAGLFPDGKDRFNLVFHARVASKQGKVRAMFAGKLELKGRKAIFVEPEHK